MKADVALLSTCIDHDLAVVPVILPLADPDLHQWGAFSHVGGRGAAFPIPLNRNPGFVDGWAGDQAVTTALLPTTSKSTSTTPSQTEAFFKPSAPSKLAVKINFFESV